MLTKTYSTPPSFKATIQMKPRTCYQQPCRIGSWKLLSHCAPSRRPRCIDNQKQHVHFQSIVLRTCYMSTTNVPVNTLANNPDGKLPCTSKQKHMTSNMFAIGILLSSEYVLACTRRRWCHHNRTQHVQFYRIALCFYRSCMFVLWPCFYARPRIPQTNKTWHVPTKNRKVARVVVEASVLSPNPKVRSNYSHIRCQPMPWSILLF